MAQLQRNETPTRFKTNVTRQIVAALRDSIQSGLFAVDFPHGVNIVNNYPLTEVQYPAIVVTFQPSVNETAGVGHEEIFDDIHGDTRTWQHRRFEGTVEFAAVALDPIERDILADALVDVLSFSHFTENEALAAFFTRMQTTPDAIGTVFQTNLDSDRIIPGGMTTTIAPWEPEDVLLYEETYSVAIMGGYYNTVLADWPGYIYHVGIDSPFMQSFAADIPAPPLPDTTPEVSQLGHGGDRAYVINAVKVATQHGTGIESHRNARLLTDTATTDDESAVGIVYDQEDSGSGDDQSSLATGSEFTVTDEGVGDDVSDVNQHSFFTVWPHADDGSDYSQADLTWGAPTQAGNHLFMVIGWRGGNNFISGIGANVPSGWTMLNPIHGVVNGTGAGLFVFYKLASASRSGTETVTFIDQAIIPELPLQWCGQLIEVDQSIITNLTPTIQDSGMDTGPSFNSGYLSGNPTGGGFVHAGSGATQADAFVLAFMCVPDGDQFQPKHLGDLDAITRPDGWQILEDTQAILNDPDSPSLISEAQADANSSTSDLRTYYDDGTYGSSDLHPAAAWLRIG